MEDGTQWMDEIQSFINVVSVNLFVELRVHFKLCGYIIGIAELHRVLYLVTPILFVLLNTNCKLWCSVSNTKCKPNKFAVPW